MKPREFRQIVREGLFTGTTLNVCEGYVMANLAVVPKEYAFDFLLFCVNNPHSCPLLDVTQPGDPRPLKIAPDADLRTDLPKYRVFQHGELGDEPTDIVKYWRDDFVAFILGATGALHPLFEGANLRFRTTGVHKTNIECGPSGPFRGQMLVTCRLFPSTQEAVRAVQISSRYPGLHGAPIHIGDPSVIGVDLQQTYSKLDPSARVAPPAPNEIALFWGCGVTPQSVAEDAKLPIFISHKAGHMFFPDVLTEELAAI